METDYESMADPDELVLAKHIWSKGHNIPPTLAADLMGMGYDVAALEAKYLN